MLACAQVLRAARWPLDGGALAQLYLSLLTYILMDQARRSYRCPACGSL